MFRLATLAAMTVVLFLSSTVRADESAEVKRLNKSIHALQQRVDRLEKQLAAAKPSTETNTQPRPTEKLQMPGPIASTGRSVSKRTRLKVSQVLQTQWQQQWWAARVLRVRADRKVRIRYVGWGPQYDEVVPRSRLQLDRRAVSKARKSASTSPWIVGSLTIGTTEFVPLQGLLASLEFDQHILVESGGQWWPAKYRGTDFSTARIHYIGWDSSWDEDVPASRIRTVPKK